MQFLSLISLMISLLALLSSSTGVQGFPEEPSEAVREHIKSVITEADVQVMQTEMAWGVQEMMRYKSIRGSWPVRSALTGEEEEEEDSSPMPLRGSKDNNNKQEFESIHHEYWNYMISIF